MINNFSTSHFEVGVPQQTTELDENNCEAASDLIVHNKRRIPDGMAHMTELCTRHKYQNNINHVTRDSGENMRLNCLKNAFSRDPISKPKKETFNVVFCTGTGRYIYHFTYLSVVLICSYIF